MSTSTLASAKDGMDDGALVRTSIAAFVKPVAQAWEKSPEAPVLARLNSSAPEGGRSADVGMLGKCTRNPVSGKVALHEATLLSDFGIVDLWERPALFGSPEELAQDPYVFKITPMPYRTWMYHQLYSNRSLVAAAVGPCGMIEKVLTAPAIDVPRRDGSWSSLLCYIPIAFISCATRDIWMAILALGMCVFLLGVAVSCNTLRWYRWSRLITFAPRVTFLAIGIMRMIANEEGAIVQLAFVAMILIGLAEFTGDYQVTWSYRKHATYKLIKVLPSRIFVCRRKGGAFLDASWSPVSSVVTGCGLWTPELALIAEIRGLIVELKPLTPEDWFFVCEKRCLTGKPTSFVGLDIFNSSRRSANDIDLEEGFKQLDEAGESVSATKALIDQVAHHSTDILS